MFDGIMNLGIGLELGNGIGLARSIYILWGIGVLGLLLKLMANIHMKAMIKASSNMATTKKRSLRIMRLKYMNGKSLGINNKGSEAFVEKNIRGMRYLGVPLPVWQRSGMLLSIVTGAIVAGGFLYYDVSWRGSPEMVTFIANGVLICAFLMLIENIFLINNKVEILKANIRDYFDNQPGQYDLKLARAETLARDQARDMASAEAAATALTEPEKGLSDAVHEVPGNSPHIENLSTDTPEDEVVLNSFLKEFFS